MSSKHFCIINRGFYSIIMPRLKRYETGVQVVGQWRGRAEANTESILAAGELPSA